MFDNSKLQLEFSRALATIVVPEEAPFFDELITPRNAKVLRKDRRSNPPLRACCCRDCFASAGNDGAGLRSWLFEKSNLNAPIARVSRVAAPRLARKTKSVFALASLGHASPFGRAWLRHA
jgi:hypothetical protein